MKRLSPNFPSRHRPRQHGAALWSVLLLALLLLGGTWASVQWAVRQPLQLPAATEDAAPLLLEVPRGSGSARIVRGLQDLGVGFQPLAAKVWLRWHGKDLKAGTYALEPGSSLLSLTEDIRQGRQAWLRVTLPEGWTLRQVRARVDALPGLRHDSAAMTEAELAAALGAEPKLGLEGRLAPDTYQVAIGSSDVALYRQAHALMQKNLAAAWAQRPADSVLKSEEEALILASIIEKESGHPADRPLVSAVFHNRLRMGMRLQTDPTVIYGMGERYQGRIRKVDLQTDTPYNTYTRAGLPPTAIAMPSQAALLAAVQPADNRQVLYFVAKGDGTGQSQFSHNLAEHNAAVRRYILRR